MLKKACVTFVVLLIIVNVLYGCGKNNEFFDDYNNFKTSYLKISKVLDVKEPYGSIEKLNEDTILKEIENLKKIKDKLKEEASTKAEKEIYENIETYYSSLDYLVYAGKNKDKLTEEERG